MPTLRCRAKAVLFAWFIDRKAAVRLAQLSWVVLLLLLILSLSGAHAQGQLRGTVLDASTHEPLMAVSIRLKHASGGTTSRPDGAFSLSLLPQYQHDTLLVSRLGYTSVAVALATLNLAEPQRFYLHKQQQKLAPVTVTAPKWVERKFGISNAKALIHFTDGTMPAGKPFEIAQIMRVGNAGAVLTSANLYLAASLPDSVTVALRFYRVEAERPAKPLTDHIIRQRVAIRQGWLRLDLAPYKIYVTEDVALGLEFVPPSTARQAIPYEIKLGGSAKSFARPVREAWRVPPHHYRLYITARVPNAARPSYATEADNLETPASARLYSVAVQDSFSLFVRLPKDYARHPKRRYPVVFLLDANVYVEMVDEALKNQRHATPAILVGVGYRDFLQMDSLRQRDYTYPVAAPADSMPLSGGGKRFLAFLQRELVPYIDQTYRTDTTNRALMGHSFGGYFAVYALVESLKTNANTFTQYVSASPSLYYGNQHLLRELTALKHLASPPRTLRLHLTIGEREMDVSKAEGASTKAAIQALVDALAARPFSAVTVDQHIYSNYGHMETAVPTFTDSVEKLLGKP